MTFDSKKARTDMDWWMKRDPYDRSTVISAGTILTEHMYPALDEIERLRDRKQQLKLDCGRLWRSKMLLGARVQELEGWLEDERANLIEAGGEPVRPKLCPEDQKDLDDLAHDQLRVEGKIGGGDMQDRIQKIGIGHGPLVNKIAEEMRRPSLTAEQRAGIQKAIDSITGVRMDDPMQYPELLALLRDLLSGSVPAWEVTEERIEAIQYAMPYIRDIPGKPVREVLRAMLEEAGQCDTK